MRKYFYLLMAVAIMCFVGCKEKNALDTGEDEGTGTGTESSLSLSDESNYVGTWIPKGDDYKEGDVYKLLCLQLKADKTSQFIVEQMEEDEDVPKGAIVGYTSSTVTAEFAQWAHVSIDGNDWSVENMTFGNFSGIVLSIDGYAFNVPSYMVTGISDFWEVLKVEKNKITVKQIPIFDASNNETFYFERTTDETMNNYIKNLQQY